MKSWKELKFWESGAWRDIQVKLNDRDITPGGPHYWPTRDKVFRALQLTPFRKVKCVILGQDPYYNGSADGLAFSCSEYSKVGLPESLRNIFDEYVDDTGFSYPHTGFLTAWASKGVLLLNTVLTVDPLKGPRSHVGFGWQMLTQEILLSLSQHDPNIVYVGWGNDAQEQINQLRGVKRVYSPHPSPRSASKGFFGSKPFSKVNALLHNANVKPINWKLP